jgi:ParB family chromosome partitioning protein
MGKNLLAKAGLVLGPRSAITPAAAIKEEGRPKTAIGGMAQFTERQSLAIQEAGQLKQKLKEYDGSLPAKRIDPTLIVRSKWANRHSLSFTDGAFKVFKEEIRESKGNVQPIKVRPLAGEVGEYEIIFGHRRHQACLELGLDVLAIIEDIDDENLFIEMDRENRLHQDLRPYEVGAMYAKVLDEGLFPSTRKLAEKIAFDHSQLSKALTLARLPFDVLNAFTNPLDLQYRWGAQITEVLQKDPDFVLATAKAIQEESPRPSSKEVFNRLCGTVPHKSKENERLQGKDGQIGTLTFNKKMGSVRIDLSNIDPKRFAAVKSAIEKLIG